MPEVEDKQALINVLKRDTGIPFDQAVDVAVLQLVAIATLNLRRTDASRIAFFAPDESFVGNYGEIPQLLEAMGNEVIWLFGQSDRFLDTAPKNSYFIMGDMIRHLKNIDVIVTATVMDCLPPTSKAVLIDHISFAPLEVESLIKSLDRGGVTLPQEYQSKEEFFEIFTAFLGFLPYFNLMKRKLLKSLERDKKIIKLISSNYPNRIFKYYSYEVRISKKKYIDMISKRYISTLLYLDNKQILSGINEIKLKYKKNLKFYDKLVCIIIKNN